ncbi:calcium-binding protein [Falsiruegeria mediterranea]|uniref:calcium-binding protein n=1 Tax=Falsiruegeria mediterranea TaxID=1280832 RepID=UPI0015F2903A|nr:calcium-binding protein [Falsiruegeria mediterranea]
MAQFEFTSGNDTLTGTNENDWFFLLERSAGGMDSIDGLVGIDGLYVELNQSNFAVDLEAGFGAIGLGVEPGDWVPGGVGTSFEIAGVERVDVINFDNRALIRGDAQDNFLSLEFGQGEIYGGAGNDTIQSYGGDVDLFGGAGDDRLFAINGASSGPVLVSGGPGTDIFNTEGTDQGIELGNLTVAEVVNGLLLSSGRNQFTLQNDVEFLELDTFSRNPTLLSYAELEAMVPRRITGTDANEVLFGTDGLDQISALGGNDWILGSLGDDTLDGGDGWDFASYANITTSGIYFAQSAAGTSVWNRFAPGGVQFNDVLLGIEGITGTSQTDLFNSTDEFYFRGLGSRDFAKMHAGTGFFDGGAGKDVLDYTRSTDGIHVSLLRGRGWEGDAAGDRFRNVERIDSGSGDDTLIGDRGANALYGAHGDDTLTGAAGDDYLNGGAGQDTAVYFYDRDQYEVTGNSSYAVVKYIGPGVGDGTDILGNIDILQFADGDLIL